MELPNFVLFEHSTGYALFKVHEFEEVGKILPQVEAGLIDKTKVQQVVGLESFSPFKSAGNALENCNSVSEGVLHPDLVTFIETNIPKKKKIKTVLGVGDPKIGQAIIETFPYLQCVHVGAVVEILRLIRLFFSNFAKGLSDVDQAKAQLGLGHSYSRSKVKFNVHRVDNMIIQAIALLDQLDKDINTFCMRIREWYSYHFPELFKIVPDQYTYCRCARFIGDRKTLTPEQMAGLVEIVADEQKVHDIYEAVRSSMGMDISPIDLINIERFTDRVVSLSDYRRDLQNYLRERMHSCAPSLATLIGEQVGARLISKAGSLTNLAKYPASAIQILGAEKALFRALKTKGATPKYGLLFHSTFIGRAAAKNKGRISRFLANKCALASRIDCFSEVPVEAFGEYLKQQVEDRLKFFDSGEFPKKNLEVMKEAVVAAAAQEAKIIKKQKKAMKKQKKAKEAEEAIKETVAVEEPVANGHTENGEADAEAEKKKRKAEKRRLKELAQQGTIKEAVVLETTSPKKKKKKQKLENGEE
uniref:Nucleolar protein 56 n=1 Tax=Romanomermis culicivorax TaxID=13658 RepID=A0A915K1P6_ROMCU